MAILETRFREHLNQIKRKYFIGPFFSGVVRALSQAEIGFNHEIVTAAVSRRRDWEVARIEISPNFYAEYIHSCEDLLFVLSHEALHYLLGHLSPEGRRLTSEYGRKVANKAMDIVINQIVYRFLNQANLKVLEFYIDWTSCPYALFLPPSKIEPSYFKMEQCRKWYDIIQDYHRGGDPLQIATYLEGLAEHIRSVHSAECDEATEIVETREGKLPGRRDRRGKSPWVLPQIFEDLLKALGFQEKVEEEAETRKARVKLKEELLSAIKEMADEEEGGIEEVTRGGGVLPYYARKDFLFLATETPPILYHGNPFPEESRGIRLYVDVSGSVEGFLPHIFYALDAIKEWIVFPIYGFSTKVFPISKKDLSKGRYATTGGTDFNCIVRHLMRSRFRKAVIVTDGDARIHPKYAEYAKRNCQILTVLVGTFEGQVKKFSHKVIRFALKG